MAFWGMAEVEGSLVIASMRRESADDHAVGRQGRAEVGHRDFTTLSGWIMGIERWCVSQAAKGEYLGARGETPVK